MLVDVSQHPSTPLLNKSSSDPSSTCIFGHRTKQSIGIQARAAMRDGLFGNISTKMGVLFQDSPDRTGLEGEKLSLSSFFAHLSSSFCLRCPWACWRVRIFVRMDIFCLFERNWRVMMEFARFDKLSIRKHWALNSSWYTVQYVLKCNGTMQYAVRDCFEVAVPSGTVCSTVQYYSLSKIRPLFQAHVWGFWMIGFHLDFLKW